MITAMRLLVAMALATALVACSRHPPSPGIPMVLESAAGAREGPPELLDCAKDSYAFVRSQDELPGRLQTAGGQIARLADPDEQVTPQDGRDIFEGAAVGREHLFVAITSPWGIVSFTNTWVFERRGPRWVGHAVAGGSGSSLEALLGHVCRQYAPRSRWTSAGVKISSCTVNSRTGLVTLAYEAAGHGGSFEIRPQDTGGGYEFRRGSIAVSGRPEPPSVAELEALRAALFGTRPAMRERDDCSYQVNVFLGALT